MRHKREHKDDECDIDDKAEHRKILEIKHRDFVMVSSRS